MCLCLCEEEDKEDRRWGDNTVPLVSFSYSHWRGGRGLLWKAGPSSPSPSPPPQVRTLLYGKGISEGKSPLSEGCTAPSWGQEEIQLPSNSLPLGAKWQPHKALELTLIINIVGAGFLKAWSLFERLGSNRTESGYISFLWGRPCDQSCCAQPQTPGLKIKISSPCEPGTTRKSRKALVFSFVKRRTRQVIDTR